MGKNDISVTLDILVFFIFLPMDLFQQIDPSSIHNDALKFLMVQLHFLIGQFTIISKDFF